MQTSTTTQSQSVTNFYAKLAQIKADNEARRMLPENKMRPEIEAMQDLIRGNGPISGFRLMGAKSLVYDNATCMLQWQMGEGSQVDTVQFTYDLIWDLYVLRFITYKGAWKLAIGKDETIEGVYVDDVHGLIERKTGFYLSLY